MQTEHVLRHTHKVRAQETPTCDEMNTAKLKQRLVTLESTWLQEDEHLKVVSSGLRLEHAKHVLCLS